MRDDALLLAYTALLLALLASLLLGCHASSLTGPSATAEEHATWHGARVTDPALLPLLDRAAPTVAARWPGWRPVGWVIESTPDFIPAPGDFYCGKVRCQDADPLTAPEVTTLRGAFYVDQDHHVKTIRVSTLRGPADTVAMLTRELCNAARWDVTHGLADRGCAP